MVCAPWGDWFFLVFAEGKSRSGFQNGRGCGDRADAGKLPFCSEDVCRCSSDLTCLCALRQWRRCWGQGGLTGRGSWATWRASIATSRCDWRWSLDRKPDEVPKVETRTRTAAVQERSCVSIFTHYYLCISPPSLQTVALHILFLLSPVVDVRPRENLQDRVPPVDLAFTCQTLPNPPFKWSVFIFLQISGVGSDANAPRVLRRGLMLRVVQFASLQQTPNGLLCMLRWYRCYTGVVGLGGCPAARFQKCLTCWKGRRLEIMDCSHPNLGNASASASRSSEVTVGGCEPIQIGDVTHLWWHTDAKKPVHFGARVVRAKMLWGEKKVFWKWTILKHVSAVFVWKYASIYQRNKMLIRIMQWNFYTLSI